MHYSSMESQIAILCITRVTSLTSVVVMLPVCLVSCPAPSLDEEGSGDTRGFFVTDWNAISAEWAGFYTCNRKNDVGKLP